MYHNPKKNMYSKYNKKIVQMFLGCFHSMVYPFCVKLEVHIILKVVTRKTSFTLNFKNHTWFIKALKVKQII
jgi:hypothetical protein